jgi:hypothetical protein
MRPGSTADAPERAQESLTHLVAELRMQLREDSYQYPRPQTSDGRDYFTLTLWKLERLARERERAPDAWERADQVIAFARARILEKLRRYAEAAEGFESVTRFDSILTEAAREAALRDRELAELAEPLEVVDAAAVEERIRAWHERAWDLRDTRWGPMAREELEAWQAMRVEQLSAEGQWDAAVEAAERVVEEHRLSKHAGRHLVRLGDLYATASRAALAEVRVADAGQRRTVALMDRAFAAWEMALELRDPETRRAAEARIEALHADARAGGDVAP